MASVLTTGEVASLLNVEPWRVRRLFEDGTFPEPVRLGLYRLIDEALVPRIAAEMRQRGWLPSPSTEAATP